MSNCNSSNCTTQAPDGAIILEPFTSIAIRLTIQALVVLAAVVGNAIVIRAVRRIYGRKPLGYTLVLNLAVGELGQVLLYPFMLYYEETWDWQFGNFLCKVINPLIIVCLTNITLTLAALAVYRWRMIADPCSTRLLSPLQTDFVIGAFWFTGVLIAIPSAVKRKTYTESFDSTLTGCREHWDSVSSHFIYLCVLLTVVYLVPILLMVVSYAMVGCKLRKHMVDTRRKSRQERRSGSMITCQTEMESKDMLDNLPLYKINVDATGGFRQENASSTKNGTATFDAKENAQRQAGIVEMEQDLLKMIYLIVFSFIICYIPYQFFFLLNLLGRWRHWAYGGIASSYFILLITFPSALHPIIYGTKSHFCAMAFSWLVRCRWRRSAHVRGVENV